MFRYFYLYMIRYPKLVVFTVLALVALSLSQFDKLRWETDARVYFPKGHEAILYDEHVADVFGVKDSIIIGIVNENGIFNTDSLARVARITEKVSELPGVLTARRLDVASLSSATQFIGSDDEIANERVMEQVPQDAATIEEVKKKVYANAELFVGNLVSQDGNATMIRAKLKEGKEYRYQSYFQVKAILMSEFGSGEEGGWSSGSGGWPKSDAGDKKAGADSQKDGEWQQGSEDWGGGWPQLISDMTTENGDRFYIAGRPVIEVTSGLNAMEDMMLMIPLLIMAIAAVLFIMFRSVRGVMLPLLVVAVAIIWTLGLMAALGVPMYTISTMLPVILMAVGIGDGIHLISHYEDIVMEDQHRDRRAIVAQLMQELGMPLMITTLTTAVGFLSLWWAEMPPFKIFGLFTAAGIVFCWLASVTMVPAMLAMMPPHVSGYLKRRRSLRTHEETGLLTRGLVSFAKTLINNRKAASLILIVLVAAVGLGTKFLYVDSSWIADFRDDSEVTRANDMLNEKFDGTIFLSVVVDGKEPGALKSPQILQRIDKLQNHIESLDDVGSSLSLVDYLKSTNKAFHAGDEAYNRLPETRREVSEYLFLLSVSGRPEQLDIVVDYAYSQANITFVIKTDHTQRLKDVIDEVNLFVDREFDGMGVDVNLAGSANNSYIWADLLIDSQVMAIVLSKLGILIMAAFLFRSFLAGLYVVLPVTLTTLLVAGAAGWFRVPLDVSTVLAAGVAIGVGVDYAVHYLYRYNYNRNRGETSQDAVFSSVRTVGKAIVLNAVVVTVGFLVLGLSQFPPHVKLGYFVSTYMVVSCVAALTLLPLLLAWAQPRQQLVKKEA